MNMRYFRVIVLLVPFFIFTAANVLAQDQTHEVAMSALKSFFTDPSARADYASENPDALKAEKDFMEFPTNIQKRLEKVVLMIMQESGTNASRHVEAGKISGPEGAFNSFSPAVQKEIQEIARELERDPEFMKKASSFK